MFTLINSIFQCSVANLFHIPGVCIPTYVCMVICCCCCFLNSVSSVFQGDDDIYTFCARCVQFMNKCIVHFFSVQIFFSFILLLLLEHTVDLVFQWHWWHLMTDSLGMVMFLFAFTMPNNAHILSHNHTHIE